MSDVVLAQRSFIAGITIISPNVAECLEFTMGTIHWKFQTLGYVRVRTYGVLPYEVAEVFQKEQIRGGEAEGDQLQQCNRWYPEQEGVWR